MRQIILSPAFNPKNTITAVKCETVLFITVALKTTLKGKGDEDSLMLFSPANPPWRGQHLKHSYYVSTGERQEYTDNKLAVR